VLFQTTINLLGVFLFLPFLNVFGDFLEKRFTDTDESATFFVSRGSSPSEVDAIKLLEEETRYLIYRVMLLNLKAFAVDEAKLQIDQTILAQIRKKNEHVKTFMQQYNYLKLAEGEILSFYSKINKSSKSTNLTRLDQLLSSVRNAMYSAKAMKDVRHDYQNFRESSQDDKYNYHKQLGTYIANFYEELHKVFISLQNGEEQEKLKNLINNNRNEFNKLVSDTNEIIENQSVEEQDLPTLLNVNSELLLSCQLIITSVKDYQLITEDSKPH
jgi:phosphate:Na+ symporter